ncbi:MAG: DUF371 domain-containing protein [Methanospirillum sp.]|nr:DUF371 domain-containing protein [Methanospirillum sp.]
MVREEEYITAQGHPHVTATHRTTFEVTTEEDLTPAGSCIIAVGADKGSGGLKRSFCEVLQSPGSILETVLSCGDESVLIRSRGSPGLTLTHQSDLVWRRSSFVCDRTIGIHTDRTARDIPRSMIDLLRNKADLEVSLVVFTPD